MGRRLRFTLLTGLLPALLAGLPVWAADPGAYPETAAVLQELQRNEIMAHRSYVAFARRAASEELFSMARLFAALQFSESIHARNFRDNLHKIGADADPPASGAIEVGTTKENLKKALSVELAEIDTHYPDYIARIRPENFQPAMDDITYAWKAEQQHRDLLKKMKSALTFFFSQVGKKLDQAEHYFVCRRCGSTLVALPKTVCPICGRDVDQYLKVENIEDTMPPSQSRENADTHRLAKIH